MDMENKSQWRINERERDILSHIDSMVFETDPVYENNSLKHNKKLPDDRDRSKCDANRKKSVDNLRKKVLHLRICHLRPVKCVE